MRAVLMYHSIDDSGSMISVSPAVFAEHVRWIAHSGIRVVALDELLVQAPANGGDAIALTFDDGFANFARAAEVLGAHALPATVFVVTGHVGRTNEWNGVVQQGVPTLPLLAWADLDAMIARGFGIGAHTHTHPRLTTLPASAVEGEMDRCADEIHRRLGLRPASFAYPYGAVDARVERLTAPKFAVAVTTRFASLAGDEPRTSIPRLDMYYFRRPGAIHRLGAGGFEVWMNWVRLRRSARERLTAPRTPAGIA